ncbi:MAG: CRISPR-associated endonuclease Cas2 [Bacteroidales bacterium]|nr:CRISPR-associated endonuclease Cas2 [Bacteroidales bacterium]
MKQFIVVAYDISDDRRRQKVVKILVNYGVRSNYSVFECVLTETQVNTMKNRLEKIVESKSDCVLYYYLCKSCVVKRESVGRVCKDGTEVVWV